jgi:NAD(P)-dependent dehydrogenase (short-subunit alcohol dehydrogenase family)
MDLTRGQVAVVTGGASGIGLALAAAFADRGLNIVIADIRPSELDNALGRLQRPGQTVIAKQTDVREPDAVDALAKATMSEFGRIDIVCNNAGVVGPSANAWEQQVSVWRWVVDVALMGTVHGIRSFVPHLVRQNSGYVVNTASMGGLMPLPSLAPYSAAKHAVVGLSETLHAELVAAGADVGVTVVCPGPVATHLPQTSAENRPADVDERGEFPDDIEEGDMMTQYGSKIMLPEDVALLTLKAIEHNQLHLLTHPDSFSAARDRLESVANDLIVPA